MAELLATLTPEKIAADKIKFAAKRRGRCAVSYRGDSKGPTTTTARRRLASYVASAHSEWAQDATVFVQWRDTVWTAARSPESIR